MIKINLQLSKYPSRKLISVTLIFAALLVATVIVHSFGSSSGPTKMVSITSPGATSGNNGSDVFGISANGRYVLFTSIASDLLPIDTNGAAQDVFLRDTQTNITALVSVNTTGTGSGNAISQTPSMSPDGRYVVFVSSATNLVPVNPGIDNNNIYERDMQMGTTRLVSVNPMTGLGGNRQSSWPVVSANGRFVAFQSRAFDLGPIDTNELEDIYVRDMQLNTTVMASVNNTGTGGGDMESGPFLSFLTNGLAISADGRYVVFQSLASNLALLPDNNFGSFDVFVRDLQAGTTNYVSVNSAGTGGSNLNSSTCSITPDGRHVVFVSFASNLTANDSNGSIRDVFIRNLQTGVTTLVSVTNTGAGANSDSPANGEGVVASDDGRYVAFQSGADNLFPNDTNSLTDVFVRDVQAGITRLVSINIAGTAAANSLSTGPAISADGRFVSFISFSSNMTSIPDANGLRDIYVRDLRTGKTALASINASGTAAGNSESLSSFISANGRYLAMTSYASNLTTIPDGNNNGDVYHFHNLAKGSTPSDFDGDGKSDLSVFRPSNASWYISQSSNNAFVARQFGSGTDQLVPGDYDNDNKTDLAVYRNGDWYVLQSTNGFILPRHFGSIGDIPVPADYDNDGKTDFAVFSPTAGTWYIERSSDLAQIVQSFGVNGDRPVPGDYDGDGDADIAVWRPSTGVWYVSLNSATNYGATQFGLSSDKPVQADYDGDGKTDIAVYRPSTGTWYVLQSLNGFRIEQFGLASDVLVPADYDGDGQSDIAVFRNGVWYIRASTGDARMSTIEAIDLTRNWGQAGDKPVPAAYVPSQ